MSTKQVIVPGDERWVEAQAALFPIYGRRVALSGWKQSAVSMVGCYTSGGRVLMILRSGGSDQQAKWGLVGGLVSFRYVCEGGEDEDIFETLARETREETGMEATREWVAANYRLLTVAQRRNVNLSYQGDFSSVIIHCGLRLSRRAAKRKLRPTKEAAAFQWVTPAEARAMLARGEIAFPVEVEAIEMAVKLTAPWWKKFFTWVRGLVSA